jgi:hypothetical protein
MVNMDTVDLIKDENVLWVLLEGAVKSRDVFLCWKIVRRIKAIETEKIIDIKE